MRTKAIVTHNEERKECCVKFVKMIKVLFGHACKVKYVKM